MNINRTLATGVITGIETRPVGDGSATNFRLENEDTTYRCVAWNDLGQQVVDGAYVLIEGKMKTRSYQTKTQPIETRHITELIVSTISPLGDSSAPF